MTSSRWFARVFLGSAVLALIVGCGGGNPPPPSIAVSVSPTTATLIGGATQTFTATVTNDSANAGVTWTATAGTVTSAGVYTAPSPVVATTATVTATSKTDPTKSGTATITLTPISVSVSPTTATLIGGATQTFTATVSSDGANAGVTWTASTGAITAGGIYTAPAVITATSATVTATSKTDPTESATATVTLTPISVGAISPPTASLGSGGSQAFTVSVANDGSNSGVTWSIGSGVGTLTASSATGVTYNAPSTAIATVTTVTLTATSVKDPTRSATAAITLNPISVTVSPASPAAMIGGATQPFTATVANDGSNSGVTWTVTGGGSFAPGTTASGAATTYTAASPVTAATAVVTATSVKDPTKSASATISLTAISVSFSTPTSNITLDSGQTLALTAAVANDSSASGAAFTTTGAGAVAPTSASGNSPATTLTATGATASSVTVTATSIKDSTKSATTSSITVNPALAITTPAGALTAAATNSTYAGATIVATGGAGTRTFALASGTLPGGLTLNASTGAIGGSITGGAGTSTFTVKVTDSATTPASVTSGNYTITVTATPLVWTSPTSSPASYIVGTAIAPIALSATGGTGAIAYAVKSGTLPAGLSITGNASTGYFLSGTPTAPTTVAGNPIVFQATDSAATPVSTSSPVITLIVNPVPLVIAPATLPTGTVNATYNNGAGYRMASTGGTGAITWSLSPAIVDGLSISPSGLIAGTPTATFAGNLSITATDSATNQQQSKTVSLPLTVTNALAITTSSPLPNGLAGSAYSTTLTAAGGSGTGYTWSVTSGQPSLTALNLTLSSAGVLSGTPSAAGSASFTVQVKDSASNTASATFSLTINGALAVTTATLPNGTVGTTYSQSLVASGGSGAGYTWSITSGANTLSAVGLSLSSGGVIGTTPTASGAVSITVKVTDSASNSATASLSFTVYATLAVTTTSLPNGTVGTSYSSQLAATGGTGTGYTWTVTSGSGLSAVGLTLSTGGLIDGTPNASESATQFTVKVTDSGGNTATATLALIVNYATLSIATTNTPSGTIGSSYSETFNATGGSGNYTWSITSGLSALQALNMSFSTGGVLSGTPNATGSYPYTVQVTDLSTNNIASAPYTLVVNGNSSPSSCGSSSYSVSGTVTYTGAKTGLAYLALNSNTCGGGGQGASVAMGAHNQPGATVVAFTIRGVPPGTYTLQAFMDTLGFGVDNAADPAGSASVTVTNASVTGVALTISDPGTVTLNSAPGVSISPFNNGALALYQPVQSNGLEQASSYTLQWGNAGLSSIAGSQTISASGSNADVILLNSAAHSSLTTGSTFYFRMYATSSGTAVSPYSSIVGPVTIGASTGGATVSGAVTFSDAATGPLYTGFYNGDTNVFYGEYIPSPVSAQAYTVQLPTSASAVYQQVAILDQNNDSVLDAGDLQNVNGTGNGTPIAITGNTTGQNLTLSSANSVPVVSTQSSKQPGSSSVSYQLDFDVTAGVKLPVAVTLVSGPNVITPMDIAVCGASGSSCSHGFQVNVAIGNTPSVGDTYSFAITYSDGTSETLTAAVTAVLNNAFATNLAPTTGTSTTPTFTWTDPANAANYTYSFFLNGPNGTIWEIPGNNCNNFGSSITSIPWNTDPTGCGSTPSVSSLTLGTAYSWQINVSDSNNNQAITQVNYQP